MEPFEEAIRHMATLVRALERKPVVNRRVNQGREPISSDRSSPIGRRPEWVNRSPCNHPLGATMRRPREWAM